MKLFKCPRRTWIRLKEATHIPPAALPVANQEEIFFDHLDGMYSYCLNKEGQLVHIAAWTEIEICKDQPEPPQEQT